MSPAFLGRKILLLDDDEDIRRVFARYLTANGFLVEETETFAAALESFEAVRPDVAVLDFRLPDGTALDLVPKLKQLEPAIPLIVLTGFGSMELGVSLIKAGAEQCLAKPIEPPSLLLVIQKVLENSRNQQKQLASITRRRRIALDPFLGESAVIQRLAETCAKVAKSHSPVLIQGETGSGKGVLANWFHENGPRADESFVDLNCAGLTREFLETELFGYEKGAYTGAVNAKPGLLEVGHRGTIFLDEIGDVDPNVQPKLLKVVEEKRFRRMGDVRDRFVDVRLIAATHQDLRQLIENKVFRSDLYFRISTVPIAIPALRERADDIPAITAALLHRICVDMARSPAELSPRAVQRLRAYYWPGNIRELRNVLERALLLNDKPVLEPSDFAFEAKAENRPPSYEPRWTLDELERFHIAHVFAEENNNVEKTAKRLGIAKSTLYQRLKAMNLT
ncbi:MAG TPA: sigma-54 dependent transcriptional regulator [Terriglobales bacterium]|jgi:DNA-binding NtrC family response regulator|nr:sigma-54 dependent transcriptional regulator [Terriglobales bacterium]